MIRRIVLLPEPEGPSRATSWPAGTSNETSFDGLERAEPLGEVLHYDAHG